MECDSNEIVSTILKQDDECHVPCHFTYLTLNNLPSPENSKTRRTFTFTISSIHTLTKSELIYSLWSYIGEFAGWAGLFIGICCIDIFDIIADWLTAVKKMRA